MPDVFLGVKLHFEFNCACSGLKGRLQKMGEGQFLMGSREAERHQANMQSAHFTPSSVDHGSKMVNSDFRMNRDSVESYLVSVKLN